MEIIIDDMEHRVRKVIATHREKADFPQLENYGIEEKDFDDYMFYKQAIIDDVDSLRKKYTIYFIIFIIPFVVMAFYETTVENFLIALAGGFVLSSLYYLLTIIINHVRMKRLNNGQIERYIADVMKYDEQHPL